MIELVQVADAHRTLLWNLHQKYLYEMTAFYADTMDAEGNYHYGYFDAYFSEPERMAFLIYADDALAGFAMVNPHSYIGETPDHVLAEFTVFPMYRRHGLALEAARCILDRLPGRWEIKYNEKNIPAKRLWNKVAEPYQPIQHRYSENETVLAFEVGK